MLLRTVMWTEDICVMFFSGQRPALLCDLPLFSPFFYFPSFFFFSQSTSWHSVRLVHFFLLFISLSFLFLFLSLSFSFIFFSVLSLHCKLLVHGVTVAVDGRCLCVVFRNGHPGVFLDVTQPTSLRHVADNDCQLSFNPAQSHQRHCRRG